jgi:hypothetical protein
MAMLAGLRTLERINADCEEFNNKVAARKEGDPPLNKLRYHAP